MDSLRLAIRDAAPGTVIRLAPGLYPGLFIRRAIDGPPVVIQGPREARLAGLRLAQPARGWRFEGVTIEAPTPPPGEPYRGRAIDLTAAARITFNRVLVTGVSPDEGPGSEGTYGLFMAKARSVVFANSIIRHVMIVAGLHDSQGVILAGNQFLDSREGVQVSHGADIAIRNNLFRGWEPRYDRQEHPDMIQFWTRGRPTGSMRVEISSNLLSAGNERSVQGIFIRAEDYEWNKAPEGYHRDFVIRNNIYYGSSPHGITVGDVRGALVENNSILASPHAFVGKRSDPSGRTSFGYVPGLRVLRTTTGTYRANLVAAITNTSTDPAANLFDNNSVYLTRGGPRFNPANSLAETLTAGDPPLAAFALLPNSPAARAGVGADAAKVGPHDAGEDIAALENEAAAMLPN